VLKAVFAVESPFHFTKFPELFPFRLEIKMTVPGHVRLSQSRIHTGRAALGEFAKFGHATIKVHLRQQLMAGLVQGTDGNFYGATFVGGTQSSKCSGFGCGTLFKITAGGTLTTLHFFDGTDGYEPSGLIQGTDGNFYGTTAGGGTGGSSSCKNGCGVGTVFKMTPSGVLTT